MILATDWTSRWVYQTESLEINQIMYYLVYKWDGVLKLSFKYSNFSISGVKIIGQLYGGGKKFYPTLCIKINFKIIKNLVVKHETKKYK